jgi:hypothetical protein
LSDTHIWWTCEWASTWEEEEEEKGNEEKEEEE